MTKPQESKPAEDKADDTAKIDAAPEAADAGPKKVKLQSKDGEHTIEVAKPSADYTNLRFGHGWTEV